MKYSIVLIALCSLFGTRNAIAQDNVQKGLDRIDPRPFADNSGHWYMGKDDKRMINPSPAKPKYQPTQLKEIGDNMVLFQKDNGGWPKNYDFFAILTDAQKDSVRSRHSELNTTFDNGTSYTHIAALSVIYKNTGDARYRDAAVKGLHFLLKAQYANGGWPQYYPLEEEGYSKEITFNDGAFEGIMELLKDIMNKQPQYDYLDAPDRKQVEQAFSKGIDCIVKTQINDAGVPTAWCQQYDEHTLQPAWARKFEPASICNGESADLVLFLMNLDHPEQRVVDAIQYAVKWFQDSKIYNTRVDVIPAPRMETPFRTSTTDRVVVRDTTAAPIWTRYYELKTHKPLFCNRDSKVVYSLAEVARERRDGYAWYTYAPQKVLNKYPSWQKKWGQGKDVLAQINRR
ncbi:pectate lyase [Niastella yeongjuensis]|uniref:Pectate lyase n=1 Tax=Niastella yeongjuensis TaxID=354355 RepID=A0A1V9E1N6_9BACT|nr:pectate lyase [Niastella yeongjuensis]OQP40026.1 pectate lyase [Niastella yeongjuensis]SEO14008.1 pectate lyase, PelA/Pel-15E family [Niastella yeongjuensis]